MSKFSDSLINCFPNNICQFFLSTPRNYQIVSTTGYYIGTNNNQMIVINSSNVIVLNTIQMQLNVNGLLDIIFLNDDQTMVTSSTNDIFLVFFN
jgi:hypothetical protein